MSTLLQVTLIFHHTPKINISDNNIEYSTLRIVFITRSNMKAFSEEYKKIEAI
jgi:hypothetical protein